MRFQLQLPLALLLVPATACVSNTSTEGPDPEEVSSALELENGGFEMTDEAALFGEDALYNSAAIEPDAVLADPMSTDAEVLAMERSVDVERRDVAIVWGRLPADPNATDARDWSGELRLSRGAMVVRRRIAFEDTNDRVNPRTSRDVISFDSRTRPFADGLLLRVYDPTPTAAEPITLTYASRDGVRTETLELRELRDRAIVRDAGDGNRIVVAARRRHDGCEHGFVRGRWHALAPNMGVYLGVVANADGDPVGHLRGIYGQRRNGEAVMFGKFISREGGFKGIFKGTYGEGEFNARWLDRSGDHGQMHGVYFAGASLRAGGFMGRWAEASCEDD